MGGIVAQHVGHRTRDCEVTGLTPTMLFRWQSNHGAAKSNSSLPAGL